MNNLGVTPRYVIITPARNEGQYLQATIDSVVAQSLRPQTWVIVDDGSTDNTGKLIDAAARQHSWIKAVHRPDRGFRKQGGGVIEAFYDGYKLVDGEPWDFLVKLDADLSFESDYFEKCLGRFAADDQLGIGGGRVYCRINGAIVEDSPNDPQFHVRGATKIYRRACWLAIGGLFKSTGWDTLDEVKANMLNWKTYSFNSLNLLQLKATGSADGGWRTWLKNGQANYIAGYHPLFMLSKCIWRMREKPYGLASAGLWVGYMSACLQGIPRVDDIDLIRYLRKQQIRCLTFRDSLWTNRQT